ncbi:hypothetical protein SOM46_09270 [Pseudomonas fluorescens]|uniref:hypothetical protein n=1 Tax=Pseudomonas fluorescens TaxID=294 RepID=UPI00177EB80D|nr:hypothetical protein [Pseudomonas fluorescens]MBD8235645.1 hypothetical protein [Pseudomonas fluorescens]MDY0895141.1 hypothetical protein [Pseudomonas fluorescens]
MEVWELIRRLLAGATGGNQSHMPGLIGTTYYWDLKRTGCELNQGFIEISDAAELFAEKMQDAELIRPAGVRGGGIAILGAMERTPFGEELYKALGRREVLASFERVDVPIDVKSIQAALLQAD